MFIVSPTMKHPNFHQLENDYTNCCIFTQGNNSQINRKRIKLSICTKLINLRNIKLFRWSQEARNCVFIFDILLQSIYMETNQNSGCFLASGIRRGMEFEKGSFSNGGNILQFERSLSYPGERIFQNELNYALKFYWFHCM